MYLKDVVLTDLFMMRVLRSYLKILRNRQIGRLSYLICLWLLLPWNDILNLVGNATYILIKIKPY